jgi:MurNAc alpha-1-phosphate uridylyltransferase
VKAIILAAGRGERLRPLTDITPKPLVEVGGKPLIVRHVEKLAAAGVTQIVINLAHLGAQIEARLGSGRELGAEIIYSHEERALGTAGGIANALQWLGDRSFAAVNADVYSDYPYTRLAAAVERLARPGAVAHLVLIDNPTHYPEGDFALRGEQVALEGPRLTFSGMAAYRAEMFAGIERGAFASLAPFLREHIALERVSGERHRGIWHDVGTAARLAAAQADFAARAR